MSDFTKAIATMDVHSYGPIRGATALTPLLKMTGGLVINVSTELSASNCVICRGRSKCTLSIKFHQQGFQQALSNWSSKAPVELKEEGILLNVVNPGWVET